MYNKKVYGVFIESLRLAVSCSPILIRITEPSIMLKMDILVV